MTERSTYLAARIYCPKCGGVLPGHFAKTSGPLTAIHRRGKIGGARCDARLIVLPAESRAYEIADQESLESALIRELKGAA